MDDKGLSSPISGPRVSSTDPEFAPDSLLEGTGIRTIGRARLVIAQANPELPWTHGETAIDASG
jgi:hypothetical protein